MGGGAVVPAWAIFPAHHHPISWVFLLLINTTWGKDNLFNIAMHQAECEW